MKKSLVLSAVLAGLAIGGSVQAQQIDVGAQLYQDYCAACHGTSGKGDGDMANVMTIPSPDLTLLGLCCANLLKAGVRLPLDRAVLRVA